MNRAPGKSDTWWVRHEADCGGTYTKIQEPIVTKKQLSAMSAKERAGRQKNKLDGWVTASTKGGRAEGDTADRPIEVDQEDKTSKIVKAKRKASTLAIDDVVENYEGKRPRQSQDERSLIVDNKTLVQCPICNEDMAEAKINEHLDIIHLS
jgi:uncharacterized protein YtpQ (UPF0354 family)